MLKKRIKYTDVDGNPLEEDFYFNLTKAEVVEFQFVMEGGLEAGIKKALESKDSAAVIELFKDVMRRAYGVRSEDGRRLMKDPKYFQEFLESEAYSNLFMELITNPLFVPEFLAGVVPSDLSQEVFAKSTAAAKQALEPTPNRGVVDGSPGEWTEPRLGQGARFIPDEPGSPMVSLQLPPDSPTNPVSEMTDDELMAELHRRQQDRVAEH